MRVCECVSVASGRNLAAPVSRDLLNVVGGGFNGHEDVLATRNPEICTESDEVLGKGEIRL